MKEKQQKTDVSRRDFLATGSIASLVTALGVNELKAQAAVETKYDTKISPPVAMGVIGCGTWGREIISTLMTIQNAPVVAISDHYGAYLRRGGRLAPKAKAYENYKDLIADKNVKAIVVATPTHQHKDIVLECLKAGKHVYCEAPLANTIEDAKAIALAAKNSPKVHFQTGLQNRSDPQRHFLLEFIRTGCMGSNVFGRGQWHKKQSWRRNSPNPARQKEINWRLKRDESVGMIGELGTNQIDSAAWTYRSLPKAVSGFGSFIRWNDDNQDVPNTIQAVFEFERGVNYSYDATLANSFDGEYEIFHGSDAAIMIRGNKAWMFKEADSPLLGWEVYARKDRFYQEEGVALVMNATKLKAQGEDGAQNAQVFTDTPLNYALSAFATNSYNHGAAVEDFTLLYGDDTSALGEHLKDTNDKKAPYATYQDAFEAAVCVIKANEAILSGKRIELDKSLFELG